MNLLKTQLLGALLASCTLLFTGCSDTKPAESLDDTAIRPPEGVEMSEDVYILD
jgi:PBP1b-binding outer membrane lipoprotein LpoB